MFHQTFPQEISFPLEIKVHKLPQSKKIRNSQKFWQTMSACPRLYFAFSKAWSSHFGGPPKIQENQDKKERYFVIRCKSNRD